MNADFLDSQEEDVIASFNGSYRKALTNNSKKKELKNNSITSEKSELNRRKNKKKQSNEVDIVNETPSIDFITSVQVRISKNNYFKLRKLLLNIYERDNIKISSKQMLDNILEAYFEKNPG